MNKLKFEGFQVGQIIRAADFAPRLGVGGCYIEGRILQVVRDGGNRGYAHYVIRISRDVWNGEEQTGGRVGEYGFVPMQSWMDWDDRVRLVEQKSVLAS